MQSDLHRMVGRMDSIEEGFSYFRGYVDRKRLERNDVCVVRRNGL